MVRATLEGRKTQTRRVGKWQNPEATELGVASIGHATKGTVLQATYRAYPNKGTARHALCEFPYGVPGDRLWVKETFLNHALAGYDPVYFYRADDETKPIDRKWRPSIFMPRAASRITLEITSVRVERLQDISAGDIIAEGAVDRPHEVPFLGKCPVSAFDGVCYPDLRSLWAKGWDSINGVKHPWSSNPWVWAIAFKLCPAGQCQSPLNGMKNPLSHVGSKECGSGGGATNFPPDQNDHA